MNERFGIAKIKSFLMKGEEFHALILQSGIEIAKFQASGIYPSFSTP
jgi:hypothetical protein